MDFIESLKLNTTVNVRSIYKQNIISREDKNRCMEECWKCANKREVPRSAHIACSDPDIKMTGNQHGIKKGWFMYPICFDPVWKTKLCSNYKEKDTVNHAVSDSVSGEDRPKTSYL